jgi:hypothetical protein
MVCVVIPLLLKRIIRVSLEPSQIVAVIPPYLLVMIPCRCDVHLLPLCCVLRHNGSNWTSQRYKTITNKKGGGG